MTISRPYSVLENVEAKGQRRLLPALHPNYAQINGHTWNSREHRKGRRHSSNANSPSPRIVWLNLDVGNISWLVGFIFTLGSAVWCINGFFVFMPSVHPNMAENDAAIAWTAWVGGTVFLFGGYSALLEALNRGHEVNFGTAVHDSLEKMEKGDKDGSPAHNSAHLHTRHIPIFRRKHHLFLTEKRSRDPEAHWVWLGARWRELGYIACLIQMGAAIIFWISVVVGLPGVLQQDTGALANGIYWLPQVIGGSGFIISGALLMLETQEKWWKIEPLKLGWQASFWNFVGGIGFTLCGALGFATSSGAEYESGCSTFWGSFAFLIGSYCQWFEGMNEELVKLKGIE